MTADPGGGPGWRARGAAIAVVGLFGVWFAAVRGVGWWGSDPTPVTDALVMVLGSAPIVFGAAAVAGLLRRRGRGAVLRWLLFTVQVTWVAMLAFVVAFSYETRVAETAPRASFLLIGLWSVLVLLAGGWLEDAIARRSTR